MCDPVTAVASLVAVAGAAYTARETRKANDVAAQAQQQAAATQLQAQQSADAARVKADADAAAAKTQAEADAATAANARIRTDRLRRRAQNSLLGSLDTDSLGGEEGRKRAPKAPPSVLAGVGGYGDALGATGGYGARPTIPVYGGGGRRSVLTR